MLLTGGVFAVIAYAGVDAISNGYYDSNGIFAPYWRNVTRVYVHDYGGAYAACEDALNSNGAWAQAYAYCASNGATWHDFCGCQSRRGWNGADFSGGYELMDGHQDY
jgi:hypothetical protein